jgi:hypothetical protein
MNHVIVLEIEGEYSNLKLKNLGGGRYFILLRAESEKSVFGVDVSELDMVVDYG